VSPRLQLLFKLSLRQIMTKVGQAKSEEQIHAIVKPGHGKLSSTRCSMKWNT
jgi:hypothetical protein